MITQRRGIESLISVAGERLDIDSIAQPPAWTEGAVCSSVDTEIFFPERGGSSRPAKAICLGCPVRAQCLRYAMDRNEWWGIWGGLSERERRRLKRSAAA